VFATALVNSGCSLQALMALGHVSAEMSLRYGRLFDAAVRADYERALVLAKERLGPVLPEATPVNIGANWRELPVIKARMAGGYCVRTLAQGACPCTNICEHCPNYRSEPTFLPILLTHRVDAKAIVEEHRTQTRDASTLSGLAIQIENLHRSLEAVSAKVRRHEEEIRRLKPRPDGE
jgi:hypothetical protein